MVGTPININGLTGVLFSADSASKEGHIKLRYFDCMQFNTTVFSKDSVVVLEDGIIKVASPEQTTIASYREPLDE